MARVQWSRRDMLNAVHIVRDLPLWGVCVCVCKFKVEYTS